MNITLKKPLIFFDLETTGIDFKKDSIIEISAKKINIDGSMENLYYLFNPDRPIDKGATDKHGYTNDMLLDYPMFGTKAKEIYNFFKGCDYGGYNAVKFDIPFLYEELSRCGLRLNEIFTCNVIDPFKIVYKMEPRTLSHYYKSIFGEDFDNAHSAEADIIATMKIFEYQIEKYGFTSIDEISTISRTDKEGNNIIDYKGLFVQKEDGNIYYGFGKNKDNWIYSDMEYLKWIAVESTFEDNVKYLAYRLLLKRLDELKKQKEDN